MRVVALTVFVLFTSLVAADEAPFILKRCTAESANGATPVNACVAQDTAAWEALKSYASATKPAVARCEDLMQTHGWSMVKACADRDIQAAAQLASYADRKTVERCQRDMGRFGAWMVKGCVDQTQ